METDLSKHEPVSKIDTAILNKSNRTNSFLWNMNIGFFGVQMAFALQSANMSRIFQTIGANPNDIGYFWLAAPLAGMFVQPLVGSLSDRTWTRFGRRLPWLYIGGLISMIVLILIPNAGNLNLGFGTTASMAFGVLSLLFLDVSSNMAMQPFKMLSGDMVNEGQKEKSYSIMTFVLNMGQVVASIFPLLLTTIGISNIAPHGVVPNTVKFSFYFAAATLLICCIYTFFKVHELPPKEYAAFHQISEKPNHKNIWELLKEAPTAFWTTGLVQLFYWAAYMYMATYATGGIAEKVWHTTNVASKGFQEAGNWFGLLSAVSAVVGAFWPLFIAKYPRQRRSFWAFSLLMGAVGLGSVFVVTNKYTLIFSFIAFGLAWGANTVIPFTILTNSLDGNNIGTYLGLFNCTICIPQILANLVGGTIIGWFGGNHGIGNQHWMMLIAGILMVLAAISVSVVHETYGEIEKHENKE
ncbi:MAG: SLC45 family MFS transporter [Lentilactobacillus diolivorans]|uniref:SLC45 family MFS transporter n=1 Tax=Lentilactobacillus diolivorans TaxID=179838 RepID=UPI0039EB6477